VASDENIHEIMGECEPSEAVIGLLIDESLEVPGAELSPAKSQGGPGLIDKIDLLEAMKLRIHGLTDTVLSAHDKAMLSAYKHLICHLPAKGIGTLEFDMPPERMEAVRKAGEVAMEAYLASRMTAESTQAELTPVVD
jgi:hypothetical protein